MRLKILLLVIFIAFSNVVMAGEVTKGKEGMYWKKYDSLETAAFFYQVDTITQTCYSIFIYGEGNGITAISCKDLSKRPEWKPIITWEQ